VPLIADSIAFAYPSGPRVLDQVSCAIETGTLTAIVGPNGAGKSTLIRLLAGLRSPDAGTIRIGDRSVSSFSQRQRAQRIAFLEQRPTLAFDFSVSRVVSFGAFTGERDCALITDALDRFELREIQDTPFASLSVGQQQRTAFARAWVQIAGREGAYLIADEPCSAMDPRHTIETMRAMQELARSGLGVCVVVHDLNIAARFADRAIVLDGAGRVASQGGLAEALCPEVLSDVFEIGISRIDLPDHPALLVVRDP
jgi:iron complex transport system ATP-binding protein